jgi:signal transduction histidine kinase
VKLFDKATLKLASVYTAILLLICVGFSVTIYSLTTRELDRPGSLRQRPVSRDIEINELFRSRASDVRGKILASLVFINLSVIVGGAVASYFLARLTLRPISQAMDEQTRFVADASHELRTPLSVMQTENEITLRGPSPTRPELLDQIASNLEEVEKLRRLTDYLLKLGSNQPLSLASVDLYGVADLAVKRLRPSAKKRKITIKNQLARGSVRSNAEALGEIMTILLENAVKYSPNGGLVTISRHGNEIRVTDEGPGIATDDLPHIFERFYRAETSRTSEGYGLGLSMAEHLAGQIGARITGANNPGKGATFTLRLPTA